MSDWDMNGEATQDEITRLRDTVAHLSSRLTSAECVLNQRLALRREIEAALGITSEMASGDALQAGLDAIRAKDAALAAAEQQIAKMDRDWSDDAATLERVAQDLTEAHARHRVTEQQLAAAEQARDELQGRLQASITGGMQAIARMEQAEAALAAEREACAKTKEAFKILDGHLADWQSAAKRVGEDLASVGPDGYYDFDPDEWRDWALAAIATREQQWGAKWDQAIDQRGDAVIALAAEREWRDLNQQRLDWYDHVCAKLQEAEKQLQAERDAHARTRESLAEVERAAAQNECDWQDEGKRLDAQIAALTAQRCEKDAQ